MSVGAENNDDDDVPGLAQVFERVLIAGSRLILLCDFTLLPLSLLTYVRTTLLELLFDLHSELLFVCTAISVLYCDLFK